MDPQRALGDLQSALAALRRQQFVSLALAALAILVGIANLTKLQTVVLEPPVRGKRITVVGERVDAAWLEETAGWIAHLMLDASPMSIQRQQEEVLHWVAPATHGPLQQEMAVQAKRLIEANASTVFWLQQVAADAERQRAVVIGQLDTYVNGVRVGSASRNVSYLAQFELRGGRTLLKEWKEVPNDDIWSARAAEQAARDARAVGRTRSAPDNTQENSDAKP